MRGEGKVRRQRSDIVAVAALCTLIVLFLLPGFALQQPLLEGDGLHQGFPRQIAVARIVQRGELPLWNPHTFAGARPFHSDLFGLAYYVPLYPLYLLADTDDPTQCLVMLGIVPLLIHVLWAALGGYAFGRIALRLHAAGGFVVGLAYSLSPHMTTPGLGAGEVCLWSYLPWCLLGLVRFLQTRTLRWWAFGVAMHALLNLVGHTALHRVYLVMGATVVAASALQLGQRRTGARVVRSTMGLLGCGGMILAAIALTAGQWAGLFEGALSAAERTALTHEAASAIRGESSLPPAGLLALLVPNVLGIVDFHGWGVALEERTTVISVIRGGLSICTAALLATGIRPARWGGSDRDVTQRHWTWISLAGLVVGLFVVMGRFTPVFRWLCTVVWPLRFPHAVYYRFAVHWFLALLAGIGVSSLLERPVPHRVVRPWQGAAACAAVAVGGIGWQLLRTTVLDSQSMPAWRSLGVMGEWGWFLGGPVLYLVVAACILVGGLAVLKPQRRAGLLTAGIAFEVLLFAWPLRYRGIAQFQVRKAPDYRTRILFKRCVRPEECPDFDFSPEFRERIREGGMRWSAEISVRDNLAWALGNRALMGYDNKALMPRYARVLGHFTRGGIFERFVTRFPVALYRNMNVGYLLVRRPAGIRDLQPVRRTSSLQLYRLPDPLPFLYAQDRVVPVDEEGQFSRLCDSDLCLAAFVDAESPGPPHLSPVPVERRAAMEEHARFQRLQETNRILALDLTRANRKRIELNVETPCMLVIAECWHAGWRARVDGTARPVQRVNYLQQGVWLEPGHHVVELRFCPDSVTAGAWIGAGTAAVLLVLLAVARQRRRRRTAGTMPS